MAILTNPRNPQWANAEHTGINLTVTHSEYGDIPFTARLNDQTPYCAQMFTEAAAGLFGPVTEFGIPRAVAVDRMWAAIKAERDRRTQKGGYKVGTVWFHSDVFSRSQQIGLVMLGANIPAGLQWKTMDGTFVTMTQTLADQVFAAAAASDQAIFAAAEVHRVAMEASATPETYDFSTGWPKVYGEV